MIDFSQMPLEIWADFLEDAGHSTTSAEEVRLWATLGLPHVGAFDDFDRDDDAGYPEDVDERGDGSWLYPAGYWREYVNEERLLRGEGHPDVYYLY